MRNFEDKKVKKLPYRKSIRLKNYDYSSNGYYFVTICTQNREKLFGEIVGSTGNHIGSPLLRDIIGWFKTMTTNEYIAGVKDGRFMPFKGRLWQRNYYEHIIRNYDDYINIADYIQNNPLKWEEDKLYITEENNGSKKKERG